MTKHFLNINEPCQQDWIAMTATQQGKFWGSCNKEVIDFTSYTDSQLVNYFKQKKEENVCGNFYQNQLSHWIEDTNLKKCHPQIYKVIVSLLLLVGSQNLNAQNSNKPEVVNLNLKQDQQKISVGKVKEEYCDTSKTKSTSERIVIRGAVSSITSREQPLIILDGVHYKFSDIKQLNPNDIESVKILKPAQATAIYGVEGANGVIIFETKKCKKNPKTKVPIS